MVKIHKPKVVENLVNVELNKPKFQNIDNEVLKILPNEVLERIILILEFGLNNMKQLIK